jgi:hypothetical protein
MAKEEVLTWEQRHAISKRIVRNNAQMFGMVIEMRRALERWESRREGTMGDIEGVKVAAELLLEAAKAWGGS